MHSTRWRHVPTLQLYATLNPHQDGLIVKPVASPSPLRRVEAVHYECAMRSVTRLRSVILDVSEDVANSTPAATCTHFLDPLFPHTASISRVRLSDLTISSSFSSSRNKRLVGSGISRCLLRCPPLRSCALRVELVHSLALANTLVSSLSVAALRHVVGSGRLLHLELQAEDLSAMVWGDGLEATRPWRGARTLQSVVLSSVGLYRMSQSEKPMMALGHRDALPSLAHLLLPSYDTDSALQHFSHHLGDRLTFLRLRLDRPLPPTELRCSALQSLHLDISPARRDALRKLALHELPYLRELTIVNKTGLNRHPTTVLPKLPASLTYLPATPLHERCDRIAGRSRQWTRRTAHRAAVLTPLPQPHTARTGTDRRSPLVTAIAVSAAHPLPRGHLA